MLASRSELPLENDPAARLLPWIIGVMVYLAALAIVGAMMVNNAVSNWSSGLSGTLTVQIPAAPKGKKATLVRVSRAVEVLRATAGVARIDVLDAKRLSALVQPWLGGNAVSDDLPLPRLIDVGVHEGVTMDLAGLRRRLSNAVPGSTVEDHQKWLEQLRDLAQSIGYLSAVVVILTVFAAVTTVVFATRTGLKVHHAITEVLHLIGARDAYIARQFQRQALVLGLKGGAIGVGLAVITVLLVGDSLGEVKAFGLPQVALSVVDWVVLAILPIAAALAAMLTARFPVLRTLGKMT
ncbi:MAG: cell division protein [Pseudomonadota bacterium]